MSRAFFIVLSAITLCGTSHINGREQSKLRNIFYSGHKRATVSERLQDQCAKTGSFKIEDGPVIGGGIYEIGDDGIDIDLKLKIKPCGKPASPTGPSPSATPPPSTSGSETTSAPEQGETTPAPEQGETTPAPQGSTIPSSNNQVTDVEQESLALHNKFREIHLAPPLTLNAELSKSAADYAAKLANLGTLQHATKSERDDAGENLSYGCSSSKGQTAEEAVTNWYNEVCNPGYTFNAESSGGGTGHFTQLVWKGSAELGFGKAEAEKNGMKCTYYVARYKPAGNMVGSYNQNVIKGSFDRSYCSTIQKRNPSASKGIDSIEKIQFENLS